MKVPLIDLQAQLQGIRDEVSTNIDDVLASCQFINGPYVTQLEQSVADYCGVGYGIGVSSGTDALLVALMALEVGAGDLVITTPYSFFATAGVIARLGATPVFVDIDPDSYNLCPSGLARWLESNPDLVTQVKALIPVHLYGQCADIGALKALTQEHNIPIVEDAAQAIGATVQVNGSTIKAGAVGDIGCFSFFPSKNLGAMGDGGMVVTDNEQLAQRLKKLRNHGAHPKYYHQLIGGNFRLDALQAAVLCAKLPHLEAWHRARQTNAAYYDERLSKIAQVKCPVLVGERSAHIYNQYVIQVPKRDELRAYLAEREVATEVYYPVAFHMQDCFAGLNYQEGDFPVAENAASSTLAIPVYPELDTAKLDFVCECIETFYA